MAKAEKSAREFIEAAVWPRVEHLKAERDAKRLKVERLEQSLVDFEKSKAALEIDIKDLTAGVAVAIGDGVDPSGIKAQIRQKRHDLDDTVEWMAKTKAELLPEAEKEWAAAQKALGDQAKTEILKAAQAFGTRMQSIMDQFSALYEDWNEGRFEFLDEHGIRPEASAFDLIPRVEFNSELDAYFRFSGPNPNIF
jgi:hypothetical protein